MTRNNRRRAAAMAALIGTLALLFGGLAPAQATSGSDPNIDVSRGTSLTIHKFAEPGPDYSRPSSKGAKLSDDQTESLVPLAGVEFEITKIGDTPSGPVGPQHQTSWPKTFVTGANGKVTADLPMGEYEVKEIGFGENRIVAPVEPFKVSLPMPHNNGWIYDVHAYPKNSVMDEISMSVDHSGAFGLGQTVSWITEATVPEMSSGQKFDQLSLTNKFASGLNVDISGIRIIHPDHGEFAPRDHGIDVVQDGQKITMTATEDDLYHLGLHEQGQTIKVRVPTTVAENNTGEGVFRSSAAVTVNGVTQEANAETRWGAIKVIQHSAATDAPLTGGVFEIRTPGGITVSVNGEQSFETDDNGELMVPGLRTLEGYQLVQTQAPAGYQTADSQTFNVLAAEKGTVSSRGAGDDNVVTVKNAQVRAFELPLTGSFGSLPFILAGLLLVVTAVVVSRVRRRQLAAAEQGPSA